MAAFVGGSGDGSATPAPVGSPADVPQYLGFLPPTINDTYYSRQWHLPKIGVPEAWHVAAGLGFTPPLVAVLDTGIDVGHPDFAGRATLGPTFVSGTTTSADDHGHGTHVAGIIGARSGNGIGVASVAPEVKILGIKVLNSSGSGTLGSVIAGLFAARAAGARLVNISFGTPTRSSVMETAISQLVADGMILVAAAGNENTDVPLYPAGLNGVIAVGAVDSADKRASFSSGGAQVKIAAPGVDMISLSRNGGYTIGSGTSQAAPVVTGAIATMLTFRPRLTATNSADILFQTGKPASGFATETRRLDLTGAMTAIR
jgi:thermitase